MKSSNTDTPSEILSSNDAELYTLKKQDEDIIVKTDEFQLRAQDICCGRGKGYWKHPGNTMFHQLVQASSNLYSECPTRNTKSRFVTSIVERIRNTGARFVKEDKQIAERWIELGETLSREKTSHAIRDHLLYKSKQQTKETCKKKEEFQKKTMKIVGAKTSHGIHQKSHSSAEDESYPTTSSTLEQFHKRRTSLEPGYSCTVINGSSINPIPLKMRKDESFVDESVLYPDIVTSEGQSSAMVANSTISLHRPSFAEDTQCLSREEILEVCDLLMLQEKDETGSHDRAAVSSGGDMIICDEGPIFPSDWI
jgi:hypothetical protein